MALQINKAPIHSILYIIIRFLVPCFFCLISLPLNEHPLLWLVIAKREVEGLQRTIQEGNSEIRQLQKHLADLERDKHTEVVKLRLEVHVYI